MEHTSEGSSGVVEREPGLQLSADQAEALLEWLRGRRHDILASEEDLGGLEVLLPLLEESSSEE